MGLLAKAVQQPEPRNAGSNSNGAMRPRGLSQFAQSTSLAADKEGLAAVREIIRDEIRLALQQHQVAQAPGAGWRQLWQQLKNLIGI
jgi:hypothetical protein